MVTKKWSECFYKRGEYQDDVFWVDAADENEASFAQGVPQPNTSSLRDPRLLVQGNPIVKTLVPGKLYEVRVHYVRLINGAKQQDDLLDSPMRIHWQVGARSEQTDQDADGNPLINSVGDPFQAEYETFTQLHLTVTRYEGEFDVQKALAFSDKVNSDHFTIRTRRGQLGVEPGQAYCENITSMPYTDDAEAVAVEYNFEFREEGFKRRLLDAGFNGIWKKDDGTKVLSRFHYGYFPFDAVSTPVRLKNGIPVKGPGGSDVFVGGGNKTPEKGAKPEGAEVEGDESGDFLIYKRKKSIAFAGLGL